MRSTGLEFCGVNGNLAWIRILSIFSNVDCKQCVPNTTGKGYKITKQTLLIGGDTRDVEVLPRLWSTITGYKVKHRPHNDVSIVVENVWSHTAWVHQVVDDN